MAGRMTAALCIALAVVVAGCGGASDEEVASVQKHAREAGQRAGEVRGEEAAHERFDYYAIYNKGFAAGYKKGQREAEESFEVEESSYGSPAHEAAEIQEEEEEEELGRFEQEPEEEEGENSYYPTTENFNEGNGSVVQCADGTYSHSGGIQGACSHHGGEAP